jgi:lipid-A-disaccharide synthase
MDRNIVEELIQSEMNTTRLKQEFDRILDTKNRERIFEDYKALKEKLGGVGASETTARLMLGYLKS